MFMIQFVIAVFLALSIVSCAHFSVDEFGVSGIAQVSRDDAIAEFSANTANGQPERWVPLVIHRAQKRTQYQLVTEQGKNNLACTGCRRIIGADAACQYRFVGTALA